MRINLYEVGGRGLLTFRYHAMKRTRVRSTRKACFRIEGHSEPVRRSLVSDTPTDRPSRLTTDECHSVKTYQGPIPDMGN